MMGKHRFAPKLYYQLSLDRLVPQDHLLRQIFEAIDFSFVYPLARPYYSTNAVSMLSDFIAFGSVFSDQLCEVPYTNPPLLAGRAMVSPD